MKAFLITSSILTSLYASSALASQPLDADDKSTIAAYKSLAMSESDMDDVSAVSGLNVLNVLGATAAGLTIDSEDSEASGSSTVSDQASENSQRKEGEDTQVFASRELKNIEEGRLNTSQANVSSDSTPEVLDETSVSGDAKNFTTTSEINYKTRNFNHQLTQLKGETISISRDLYIDLLKIENLSGDHYENRSVGNIYLSDWSSRGDTTLTPR